ncbi:hypothetical protein CK203_030738 [Vitis vinifera]|uniref:Uncharacterized protein n=1 Tax=Vitis vinifera TaxID=29760 RepID=A0A438DXF2_VITVI|nr:hypothetical protein CK203_081940 [Vitis vinifera]RVW99374.1 hypothetical protein CK203_030738 [Vitis vinifera]
MEAINPKRRGFNKSKLVKYLHQVAKPSLLLQYGSSKVKPRPSSTSKMDHVSTPPALMLDSFGDTKISYLHGSHGCAADENVDTKAATYISYVRERFKLERSDSDRRKYQEKH